MLFFIISDQASAGIHLTLARVLQAAFLAMLFLRLSLKHTRLIVPNSVFYLYRYYTIYILLLVAASLSGLVFYGTYTLNNPYRVDYSSFVVEVIRGPFTRPLFEVVIIVYYLFYFVVLPMYMCKSEKELSYLFRWVIRTFYFMLCVGFLDLISNLLGWGYIPKHLVNTEFGYVGLRFHALLGEPRDAVPYLVFGLAVIYLWRALVSKRRVSFVLLPVVLLAVLLTQSASGAIGFGIGAVGMLIYFSLKSLRKLVLGIVVVGLLLAMVGVLVKFSPRLLLYIEVFSDLWTILNSGEKLPYLAAVQSSNVLPFWNMWINLKELNVMPVIFGSGIGTTSIINNNLSAGLIEGATSEIMNPHAQITRIVFESGLVGFLIYLSIFINPVKKFLRTLPANQDWNFIMFLFLLGVSLSHRSTTIFIYLGIIMSLLTNWSGKLGQSEAVATFRR
jgi:hypothetical protein